jgi:hypothetical protein
MTTFAMTDSHGMSTPYPFTLYIQARELLPVFLSYTSHLLQLFRQHGFSDRIVSRLIDYLFTTLKQLDLNNIAVTSVLGGRTEVSASGSGSAAGSGLVYSQVAAVVVENIAAIHSNSVQCITVVFSRYHKHRQHILSEYLPVFLVAYTSSTSSSKTNVSKLFCYQSVGSGMCADAGSGAGDRSKPDFKPPLVAAMSSGGMDVEGRITMSLASLLLVLQSVCQWDESTAVSEVSGQEDRVHVRGHEQGDSCGAKREESPAPTASTDLRMGQASSTRSAALSPSRGGRKRRRGAASEVEEVVEVVPEKCVDGAARPVSRSARCFNLRLRSCERCCSVFLRDLFQVCV